MGEIHFLILAKFRSIFNNSLDFLLRVSPLYKFDTTNYVIWQIRGVFIMLS